VKGVKLATCCCAALAPLTGGEAALGATGTPAPAIDAVASARAHGRSRTLASPKLHTYSAHALVLVFVEASGSGPGERVSRVSGDGLRFSPVARSDSGGSAAEVWQAHATRRFEGPIVAALHTAAYPASITVVAFSGPSPYVNAHAVSQGHASAPGMKLDPAAGSLLWAVGRGEGQRAGISPVAGQRLVFESLGRRGHTGGWVQVTTPTSSPTVRVADRSRSRNWGLAAVDVAIPAASGAGAGRSAKAVAAGSSEPGCTPSSGFEVGVEDDPVFLGQQPAMTPTEGFELGARVFDAHLLRLNVIWGEVKLYGWAPYDRAVQMARERCWTVQMTIMPTPAYAETYLNSELSASNLNLGLLASFTTEIATRYGSQVGRFSIGNEPNEGKFLGHVGSLEEDMAAYDQMYMVGYNAVRAVDPGAQVIAGELAGNHLIEWLENVDKLPSNGIAIHPYGLPHQIAQFASIIYPIPLLVSEDGVQASDPNQIEDDLKREQWAREAGATEFVFYQLSRADVNEGSWDTGIQ
jgi:hypothetical protein